MILFRTHKFDAEARTFCERLRAEAGPPVVCLVDERKGVVDVAPFDKISLDGATLRRHGLLATPDAAWRCGDYGLYLALQRYPEVERFWLVEYDVRINTAQSLGAFFSAFDRSQADLIAPLLTERDAHWWWAPAMQVGAQPVFGCLFPLLRASAPLLRAAWALRRRHARSPIYGLFWPNDESFLASTAARGGFAVEDLNAARRWYTPSSFSFERPWSGAALERSQPDELVYHPVLFGEELDRKLTKLATPTRLSERLRRKTRTLLRGLA